MGQHKEFRDYILGRVVLRTALLLLVLVFGFLAVDNWVARWDLTEDERYSISPASHRIASSLEDPLTIRAYFSGRIPEWIQPMQRQVFDILAEYEAQSNGKIKVERYDPLESASAKSEAASYGVRESQIAVREATGVSAQQVYGSIVLIYGDRAPQVINIAERYPQGYDGLSVLESELSGKIWELSHEKPKIGFTGYLEREGRGNPMTGMAGQPRPEFNELRAKLGSLFDIEDVDLDREDLDPKKVPLLLVIRPKDFTDVAVFRLDQYLVKGGRVLLFITEGVIDQGFDRRFTYEPFKTGLDGWLEHHGLRVPNEFVCQLYNTTEIPVRRVVPELGNMQVDMPEPNWFWPIVGLEEAYDRDNPAVQKLKSVDLYWPHPVDVLDNRLEGRKATVLVRSHAAESWRWKDLRRVDIRNVNTKEDGPSRSDLMSSPVVVALDGAFTSYFAERPVPPSLTPKKEGEGPGEGEGGEGE
ncbi:MAG: GldG family protein, partial [Planctomycetota bacterium]